MSDLEMIRGFGILNRTYVSYMSNALREKDVSYSDSIFLMNIGNLPGICQDDIVKNLMIDKGAVARSVKNLVAKGYVEIIKDVEDKRINRLFMTPKGQALFEFINDKNQERVELLFKDFNESEKKFFGEMVAKVSNRSKEI